MKNRMLGLVTVEQPPPSPRNAVPSGFVTLTTLALGLYYRAAYLIGLFESQLPTLF